MAEILSQEKLLLSQLRQGDSRAVKLWYQKYHQLLLRFALKKTSDITIAEELVQETFINALKSLNLFREKSSLSTWMISILSHEIADYYRKIYAKRAIRVLPLSDLLLGEPVADSHEVSHKVLKVLHQMVDSHQELLLLKYADGRGVKEIAAELGRSVKAVESDLFRARIEFRRLYVVVDRELVHEC